MNHDYAHCLDYTKDCPKECFRAELQRDIEENRSEFIGIPLTYSHLSGTEECELAREKRMNNTISRQEAINLLLAEGMITAAIYIKRMPSAQPEVKPISYADCANALMMMWIDKVITDGEYKKIMNKLNTCEMKKREGEER